MRTGQALLETKQKSQRYAKNYICKINQRESVLDPSLDLFDNETKPILIAELVNNLFHSDVSCVADSMS